MKQSVGLPNDLAEQMIDINLMHVHVFTSTCMCNNYARKRSFLHPTCLTRYLRRKPVELHLVYKYREYQCIVVYSPMLSTGNVLKTSRNETKLLTQSLLEC